MLLYDTPHVCNKTLKYNDNNLKSKWTWKESIHYFELINSASLIPCFSFVVCTFFFFLKGLSLSKPDIASSEKIPTLLTK